MSETTRTRAEIQAEIEKLKAEMESAWPKEGDTIYLEAVINQIDDDPDGIVDVMIYGDGDIYQINAQALIPAAELIPRAEHERALLAANTRTDKVVLHLNARDAVAYLVKEYDLDTGHIDSARPRTYPFDHNGHVYEVVVRRKGEVVAPQAVAPKGVVEELRNASIRIGKYAYSDGVKYGQANNDHEAALARITELLEPSEYWRERIEYFTDIDSIEINCGIYGKLKLRSYQVRALCGCLLALLESEGDHD